MTRDDIKREFDNFVEFPTEDRAVVTVTSTLLFAEHCVAKAVEAERRAIAQYLIDQGTIMAGAEDVYYIDYDDIEAIRQGRYIGIHPS